MTPDEAAQLLLQRACLLLQGLPRGTHIMLDLHAAQTDTKFEGYKLVPPGVHCLAWQTASADAMAASGMRTAWFLYTKPKQVVGRQYAPEEDAWHPISHIGDAELVVAPEHIQQLDPHLAPYAALDGWSRLTTHLDSDCTTLARVFSVKLGEDAVCDSFTPVQEHEEVLSDRELRARSDAQEGLVFSSGTMHRRMHDARDDAEVLVEGAASDTEEDLSSEDEGAPAAPPAVTVLQFTPFALQRSWPHAARGAERTRYSIDKSWLLEDVLQRAAAADALHAKRQRHVPPAQGCVPLLREMELAFVLFLQVNNASALEHWLALISLFARASSRLGAPGAHERHPCEWGNAAVPYAAPQLEAHIAFLDVLRAQLSVLPPTCWAEDLAMAEPRVLSDLGQLRTHIARALGAWAAAPHPASHEPPHEALLRAWRALCMTTQVRFQWQLHAVLDEEAEAEADDLEDGDDAPVIVDAGYPYTL